MKSRTEQPVPVAAREPVRVDWLVLRCKANAGIAHAFVNGSEVSGCTRYRATDAATPALPTDRKCQWCSRGATT